jgi:hypothetical protein
VGDLAGELFQDGAGAFEVLGLAADHREQLAVARRRDRAEHRRFDQACAGRLDHRRKFAPGHRLQGAHVDEQLAADVAGQITVLAAKDVPYAAVFGDDRDHGVGAVGHRAGMRRDRHAVSGGGLHRHRVAVPADHVEAGAGEPRLDGAAHAAQSDKADLHRSFSSARWLFARP